MLKTRTVKQIDVDDWNAFVKKVYGKPYDFQQQDGCKERGVFYFKVPIDYQDDYENSELPEKVNHPEMGVSFEAWLKRSPEQSLNAEDWNHPASIEMWWERNFYPDVSMIITDLHERELLAEGDYMIDICW